MGRENSRSCVKRTASDVSTSTPNTAKGHADLRRAPVQSYLQHYTEPSADPIPATSHLSDDTLLPLGPGTFTHNASGVPIIITCTKADLIDESNDLVAGASGMGGMVKGKGGEWEERTDGVMQILRTICLKCRLFHDSHDLSQSLMHHI